MARYTDPETGLSFTGPEGLSPEDIEAGFAMAAQNVKAADKIKSVKDNAPKAGYVDYAIDSMKKAPGEAVRLGGEIMQMATGAPLGTPQAAQEEEALKRGQAAVDQFFGVKNLIPASKSVELVGGSAGALTDPINAIIPGGGIVARMLGSYLPTLAGRTAAETAQMAGAPAAVQVGAGVLGGGAGALTQAGVNRGARVGKSLWDVRKTTGDLKEKAFSKAMGQAEQHIQNTMRAAVEADPSIAQKIMQAQEEARLLGIEDLPISAIADNPVIKDAIRTLANSDSRFAALYMRQFNEAVDGLENYRKGLYGDPVRAKDTLQDGVLEPSSQAPTRAPWSEIDKGFKDMARQAGKPLAPRHNDETLSGQLGKLLSENETPDKISPKSKPLYAKVDEAAANSYLSEGSVMNIYRAAKGSQDDSPFARFPTLWAKIRNEFAPVVDPKNPETKQWNPASYEHTKSLKSAISAEYRRLSRADPEYWNKRAELTKLRKTVDEAIDKDFTPEVNQLWKTADSQYAWDFTLNDMSKKVFDEEGVLDPKKLRSWLLDPKNRNALHNIKNAEGQTIAEVSINPAQTVAKILEKRDEIKGTYQQLHNQRILDISGMTPNEIVNKMYADNRFVGQFLQQYGKKPETLNALRSFMLDDIVNSNKPVTELLKDKNKASTYNRVFGPDYDKKVLQVASLAERLKKDPSNVPFDFKRAISQDILEESFGVPIKTVFSKLRNPIISVKQAIVELGSQAMTAHANTVYEQRMKAALLDPKVLKEYLEAVTPAGPKADVKGAAESWAKKYIFGEAKTTLDKTKRGAAVGGVDAFQRQENKENTEQPFDLTGGGLFR